MTDVSRIGGVPEPQRPEQRPNINRRRSAPESQSIGENDGLALSPEAQRAAEALRFTEFARSQPDVRQDAVNAARERLERGDLDQRDVVANAIRRLLENLG